ncbi:hypothetical protein [Euzebya tangerina]|uniref:hypothetical protein n=1 Tax=Euzebya tangerina TaxID=591198 RepID=UPI000E3183B6|nr:hypothetical protein [Euzebya tangerina]
MTDGNPDKVRYFAGPDATGIPTMKRLLGDDRHFATVKNATLREPSRVTRVLGRPLSRSGDQTVDIDLPEIGHAA